MKSDSVLTKLILRLFPTGMLRGHLREAAGLFWRVTQRQGLGTAVQLSLGVIRRQAARYSWRRLVRRWWPDPRAYSPPTVSAPRLRAHTASVEVVICVHNALEDIHACLEALLRYTRPPYRLLLVDDGSGPDTQQYLAQFAQEQNARLLRNDIAQGYTRAANQGLHRTTADYVILLNSDTVVTSDWLDRMIACAESDRRIGLVGPLSNTASWQSVPEIFDAHQDWADNELPPDVSIPNMAQDVAAYSGRVYPRLPFLNGFCLLLTRSLIERVGYFDEVNFGQGYGEENDYCLRARQAGWQLAVADDVYIFHRQSRSYSHERRRSLSEHANQALITKHGPQLVGQGVAECRDHPVLAGVRARTRVMADQQQLRAAGRQCWEGRRVFILLPVGEPGGGSNVIVQEARAMRAMGVDVQLVNLSANRLFFGASYIERQMPVRYVDRPEDLGDLLAGGDAGVATLYVSVDWLAPLTALKPSPVLGYYIQDFEPYFFPKGSPDYEVAWRSYTRYPGLVRITKTHWNADIIKREIGVDCAVVGPSVDLDLYRPRPRERAWPEAPLRIAAMIRPNTPRRQPGLTMEVLRELERAHGANVELTLFGCASDDPGFLSLPRDFRWRNAGVLAPPQLASLLSETDIFVDFSAFQAMGLTALEAMASGATVIVPEAGGASSFVRPDRNGLIVDTTSSSACASALVRLVRDEALRRQLRQQALQDVASFFPERAAYAMLAALLPA